MNVDDRKLSVSVKDLVFIIGIVLSFAGNWFSLNARVREFEIIQKADDKIRDAQFDALKLEVKSLSLQIEQLKAFHISTAKK